MHKTNETTFVPESQKIHLLPSHSPKVCGKGHLFSGEIIFGGVVTRKRPGSRISVDLCGSRAIVKGSGLLENGGAGLPVALVCDREVCC